VKNGKKRHKDIFELVESRMTPQSIARSDAKARKMLVGIRLAEFRRKLGVDQGKVKGFKQPDVSKIEGRGDVKLSTLIEYLPWPWCRIESSGTEKRGRLRAAGGLITFGLIYWRPP